MLQVPLRQHLPMAFPDNRLTPRLAAPRGTGRRAVSVHEEQLREPECPVELGSKWGLVGDPEPPLHPTLEEAGGSMVAPHVPRAAACLSWRGATGGAGVLNDGIAAMRGGSLGIEVGSGSSRAAWARRQEPGDCAPP